MKIAFIVGSLELGRDGVGDYTRSLAQECVRQGHRCALLALHDRWNAEVEVSTVPVEGTEESIELLRLPQSLSWRERARLAQNFFDEFSPSWVSLQFVPYSYQAKGVVYNLLGSLRPLLKNRRVHIMFHELWIGAYTNAGRKERAIGKLQKHFILQLTRRLRPDAVHTSNITYVSMLAQNGVCAAILPLFGNIPIVAAESGWLYEQFAKAKIGLTKTNRKQWWVFGFFGSLSSAWPSEPLFSAIDQAAQRADRQVLVASSGRLGDEACWDQLITRYSQRFSFLKLGELPADKVSQYLQFLDFGIAVTPYEIIGKSGVVATMMEHGLPVVVNRDDWHLRGESSLSSATDPLLHKLDDALDNQLVAGLPKQKPEQKLSQVASNFLGSLCSHMA